jgi:hypothetical protein
MKYESYVTSGICKKPILATDQAEGNIVWEADKGWTKRMGAAAPPNLTGATEMVLYNPTEEPCQATLTVYFLEHEPYTFEPIDVPAERNVGLTMPEWDPTVFEDVGFWGARVVSTTPLVAVLSDTLMYYHENDTFKGGSTHFLGTKLNKQWHFADGLWLEWKRFHKGDVSKAPFPFNEIEYYYFLNPGPREAKVDMTLQYRFIEHTTFHLRVPAERVYVWCNYEKIPYNQAYGVKVVSTEPISTASTRFIYGVNGLEEWGLTPHTGMPAEPGPITE